MATYAVMRRRRQPGFKVEVVADDGSRHTILGFDTELEAADWAAADRQLERSRSRAVEAGYPPGSLAAPQQSNG
jgi:hypothetical protein